LAGQLNPDLLHDLLGEIFALANRPETMVGAARRNPAIKYSTAPPSRIASRKQRTHVGNCSSADNSLICAK
jgi:hypothetical protein